MVDIKMQLTTRSKVEIRLKRSKLIRSRLSTVIIYLVIWIRGEVGFLSFLFFRKRINVEPHIKRLKKNLKMNLMRK